MEKPHTIRITDLAQPQLDDVQKAALAYGESQPVDLRVSAVLEAAVDKTGLSDFGPRDFEERLALWLAEVDENPESTSLGRLNHFGDCVRFASNRLQIEKLLRDHPEIRDVEISRPLIVLGLPRSGTTHLVNLIGADSRLRSLPLWESMEPVGDGREYDPETEDPRYIRSARAWEGMQAVVPLLAAMHPMIPDHIHEENDLQRPDFSSYNLEWTARAPRWRDYYLAHDQRPHYAYMKTVLQILQWAKPRERWVLKSPQHLEQIGPLCETFPDATFIVTHRDPVSVIQSAATMLCYGARMNYTQTRPEWYIEYWSDRIRGLLEASVRDRQLLPADRTLDVFFQDLRADDVGTVRRIYQLAGFEMTPAALREIEHYSTSHERGHGGQVIYDIRSDFSVEPKEVRAGFEPYLEFFAPNIEVEVQ